MTVRFIAVVVALLACVVTTASAAGRPKWHELEHYTFDKYVADFGRSYEKGTEEYAFRETIFNRKLSVIRAHNADSKMTWRRGVNMFTDLSDKEWKQFNKATKSPTRQAPAKVHAAPSNYKAPLMVDYRTWTNPSVLTAIKHQGSCGSCWAHAATETMEAHYSLHTGLLPVLSAQQITSCTPAPNAGCNGGDPALGFMYINTTYHGLTEEWAYPYSNFFFDYRDPNATTSACVNTTNLFPNKHRPYSWFAELNRAGVVGYGSAVANSATSTQSALANEGPLAIGVAAGNWQDYETGIFQNSNATGPNNEWGIDHAVQMVGYGHDGDLHMDYWIVRNSWSTLWGEAGYIRLYRASDPSQEPCSPAAYGPVCGTSGCLADNSWPLVKQNAGQKW